LTATTPTAALIAATAAVVVALVGGVFAWRNSGRASVSGDQRAWLQTSIDEARKLKKDVDEAEQVAGRAKSAAAEATHEAEAAKRQLAALNAQTQDLIGWIGRVVRAAHAIDADQVDDPKMQRLLEVINGGPPTFSSDRIRVPKP
jgi:hypothetical protein